MSQIWGTKYLYRCLTVFHILPVKLTYLAMCFGHRANTRSTNHTLVFGKFVNREIIGRGGGLTQSVLGLGAWLFFTYFLLNEEMVTFATIQIGY